MILAKPILVCGPLRDFRRNLDFREGGDALLCGLIRPLLPALLLSLATKITAIGQAVYRHSKNHHFAGRLSVISGLLPEQARGFPVGAPACVRGLRVPVAVLLPPLPANPIRPGWDDLIL